MARVCTLKDWLKAFSQKQEEDFKFFSDLLAEPRVTRELAEEIQRRLYERRKFSAIFKTLSWQNLSTEELAWCERKLEEVLRKEDELHKLVDLLLEIFGERSEEAVKKKEAFKAYLKNWLGPLDKS